ncbi:MAG: ribonuclease HII [Chlamydiota bacterium]
MDEQLPTEERIRLLAMTELELGARWRGFHRIAGVDEAGRGPLAGPVVAAACILPEDALIAGVDDSKKLSPSKRFEIFQRLISDPRIEYGIGIISPEIIDQVNILQATFLAMLAAVSHLTTPPDFLLIDGNRKPPFSIPLDLIVKGDSRSQSIAAASIIAKETRDELMRALDQSYPQYGFAIHKGYGTKAHTQALFQHGPSPVHRKSFLKKLMTQSHMVGL